ncbi:MAG TPA: cellulose binding domain-containing protein [Polyangia bacterium]|nr:cellulose binding domain-containing protein [Polyangia bacterium]
MLALAWAAGCLGQGAPSDQVVASLTSGATSAVVALSSDWGAGYCANVTVSNSGASATTSWQVVINLNQSTLSNIWSASDTLSGTQMTAAPLAYDAAIGPGGSVTFGFCGSATGSNYRPTIVSASATGNGGGTTTGAGGSPASGGTTGSGGAKGGASGSGGTPASGGAPGSGGTPGSGGSSSAQCTLPWATNDGTGSFTWYYFGQGTGQDSLGYRTACGYTGHEPSGQDSDTVMNIATPGYFAAVPGATGSNFNTVNHCGACAQITNGSKSVIVTIIDECPEDSNPVCANNPNGHLDLSRPAWSALGFPTGNPTGTTWKYVPCPVSGGIVVRGKSGNANQIYIENVVLPIASVSVNGAAATHLSYGAWQLPVNASVGLPLTLTDAAGRVTTVKIADTNPADNTSTGTQEPLCQ